MPAIMIVPSLEMALMAPKYAIKNRLLHPMTLVKSCYVAVFLRTLQYRDRDAYGLTVGILYPCIAEQGHTRSRLHRSMSFLMWGMAVVS
jgi:hypothetical protein